MASTRTRSSRCRSPTRSTCTPSRRATSPARDREGGYDAPRVGYRGHAFRISTMLGGLPLQVDGHANGPARLALAAPGIGPARLALARDRRSRWWEDFAENESFVVGDE